MTVRCTPCRLYRIGHSLPEFGELCDCKSSDGTRFEIREDTSMRQAIHNWFFRGRKVDLVSLDSVSLYERVLSALSQPHVRFSHPSFENGQTGSRREFTGPVL